MAALMNAENAKSLHLEHPYGFFADDEIASPRRRSPRRTGTSSRTSVATTGRRTAATPTRRTSRATPASSTARSARWPAAFAGVAESALKLADKVGVSHAAVYFAMLNGASDSTPDDRAFAGVDVRRRD